MAKIERKFMAHYINATPSGEASYERLGSDLEEFNVEMNAEIETKSNILGETSVNLSQYQAQASVEPFYADKDTKLFTLLQDIIDNRKVLDDAKTDVLEVHTWEEASAGAYTAYKESAIVEVTSYGGDTTGYQIPFNLHYLGDRVKGTFNPTTKTFTAEE
ncbi:MAG: hypothetical protein IJ428_05810 [Clostridia bacterium]|nr:hypothetical protein [Clostridia bacterium]